MKHIYLSTACLHNRHNHCKASTNQQGEPKIAATCKWCASPCVCECHGATFVTSEAFAVPAERPWETTLDDSGGDLG